MSDVSVRTRYRRALFHPLNIFLVAVLGAVSLLFRDEIVLLVCAAIEALYLVLVPNSRFFVDYLLRKDEEREAEASRTEYDRLVGKLDEANWNRHKAIKDLFRDIEERLRQARDSVTALVADQGLRRADTLVFNHLRMLLALQDLAAYRAQVKPEEIRRQIGEREKEAATEASPEVQKIKRSNVEVLRERLKRIEKAAEQERMLQANVSAVEDTIRLLRDSTQTLDSPREISEKIEDVVTEVSSNEQLMKDLGALMKSEDGLSQQTTGTTKIRLRT